MSIELINSPTSSTTTPQTDFATPVINYLNSFINTYTKTGIINNGNILNGTVLCFNGAMYKATSNTIISGTESNYVKITASGTSASAAYVSSLPSVTYNTEYGGYYDENNNLYLFDELNAITDGYITDRYFTLPPKGKKDLYTAGDIIISAAKNLPTVATTGTIASLSVSKGGFVRISINYTKESGNLILRQNGINMYTIDTTEKTNRTSYTVDTVCAAGDTFSVYAYTNDVHTSALTIIYMFTIGSGIE